MPTESACRPVGEVQALGPLGLTQVSLGAPVALLLYLQNGGDTGSALEHGWPHARFRLGCFLFLHPDLLGIVVLLNSLVIVDKNYRKSLYITCSLLYLSSCENTHGLKIKRFLLLPGGRAWERPRNGRGHGPRAPDAEQAEPAGGGVQAAALRGVCGRAVFVHHRRAAQEPAGVRGAHPGGPPVPSVPSQHSCVMIQVPLCWLLHVKILHLRRKTNILPTVHACITFFPLELDYLEVFRCSVIKYMK